MNSARLFKRSVCIALLLAAFLLPFHARAYFNYWFWVAWDTNCAGPAWHADVGRGSGWCDSGYGAPPTAVAPGFGYVFEQNSGNSFLWKFDTCLYCVPCGGPVSETNLITWDYTNYTPKTVWHLTCDGFTNRAPSDDEDGLIARFNTGGGGPTLPPPPDCPTCNDNCDDEQGMCVWRVSEPWLSLWLRDEPLGYSPAAGPRISLKLGWKQRENYAGLDPSIFGVGKLWNFSWLSYVRLDINGHPVVHFTTGKEITFYGSQDYLTNTRLTGNTTSGFTVTDSSGSQNIYGLVVTNASGQFVKAFLTSRQNPAGQATTFNYTVNTNATSPVVRLQTVVDGDGRTNTVYYVSANSYSTNLISQVVDPFNRTNSYGFDSSGHCTNITDVQGIQSLLTYSGDLVSSLTTPYGTTSFTITDPGYIVPNGRSILITQPDGGHQLYLYTNGAPGLSNSYPSGLVPDTSPFANTLDNAELNARNTFYWGPRQYANLSTTTVSSFSTADFLKARMKHWLKEDNFISTIGSTLSMQREPSPDAGGDVEGQKTWYDYIGKTNAQYQGTQIQPLLMARVLPDGTTAFTRTDRNSLGAVTTNVSTYSISGTILLRTNISTYASDDIDLLTLKNALGVQVSSNAYNAYHQVVTNYNALSEMSVYAYNASHELISTIRPSGLITTNIYGSDGLLSSTFDYEVVGGSPIYYRTNSYSYTNNLVYTHMDERGLVTTNLYDNLQRLTNSSDSRGAMKYIYTNLDLVRVIDRMGFTNSFGFDAMRRKIAETNALGYYTLFSYCNCGSLDSIRDAMGNTNYFFYNNAGRLLSTVYADNFSVTNNLNLLGQITNVIDSAGYSVTNWFNNQGLQYAATTAAGNLQYLDFDILDRATNSVDSEGVSTGMTYDDLDRMLTRAYPDGGLEKFGYSPRGMVAYTNQIGLSNFFAFDALGRKTFETNANFELIHYTNNPAGDLLSLTDGKNQTTRWKYDKYGRVTNKTDQASVEILRYTYDANNRLTTRWSAAKGQTTYQYSRVGSLTNIFYPASGTVTFSYDALNRMTNMVDSFGTTKYTYNAAGQLLTEDGPFTSDTVTNIYSNRLRTGLSLQQPTGLWTNGFAYDSTKRLTNVTSPAGAFGYLYENGIFTRHASRITLPNTAYVTNIYDGNARLTDTYLKNSANASLDSYSYIYNLASQRTNLSRLDLSTVGYKYDKIGQLTVANGSVDSEDRGYYYDSAWNLNYRTNNGVVSTFSVDSKNQLTSSPGGAPFHDDNGNLTELYDGTFDTAGYNDENRLIWIQVTDSRRCEFYYDGLGRLRQRIEYVWDAVISGWDVGDLVDYIYDGWRVIQERNSGNTPTVSYTRGNDLSGSMEGAGGIGGLLARSSGYSGGNWTDHAYYFADGNGNVTYMLDSSQSMVASYRYDPFGNTISKSGTLADANVYRFSSKEIHVSSGMYYYGYRFYDPNLQRWINRDPLDERGGINLYEFVKNAPVNKFDSLGLRTFSWTPSGCGQKYYTAFIQVGGGGTLLHPGSFVDVGSYVGLSTSPNYPPLYPNGRALTMSPPGSNNAFSDEPSEGMLSGLRFEVCRVCLTPCSGTRLLPHNRGYGVRPEKFCGFSIVSIGPCRSYTLGAPASTTSNNIDLESDNYGTGADTPSAHFRQTVNSSYPDALNGGCIHQ